MDTKKISDETGISERAIKEIIDYERVSYKRRLPSRHNWFSTNDYKDSLRNDCPAF